MNRKISLVTGGAGFIGSHVVDNLINLGHKVIILDNLSGGFESNINKKAIFVKGSINNEILLDELFEKYRFDYVYHLAAYAAEGLSHFIRKFNYENNLVGSINLINRAVRFNIKHFIFTSSIAVYGANQTPMNEDLIPSPEDPYGIAKYAVEMDLRSSHEMFGLTYTIFRPHNVYGERQNLCDLYRNVIGIFINNIMRGKPMTIYGDGRQTRAFSYIGDIVPYIANCINVKETKNEILNIGADKPYTILELARKIAKKMNVKLKIKFLPPRKEVIHTFSNHDKVNKVFGIRKTTDLDIGLEKMVSWAKKQKVFKPKKFKAIEINKNLPTNYR